jgi:hypothetical protein
VAREATLLFRLADGTLWGGGRVPDAPPSLVSELIG